MPDAAPALQPKSEYAIRLANADVWSDMNGENTLGTLMIDDTAPGTA